MLKVVYPDSARVLGVLKVVYHDASRALGVLWDVVAASFLGVDRGNLVSDHRVLGFTDIFVARGHRFRALAVQNRIGG